VTLHTNKRGIAQNRGIAQRQVQDFLKGHSATPSWTALKTEVTAAFSIEDWEFQMEDVREALMAHEEEVKARPAAPPLAKPVKRTKEGAALAANTAATTAATGGGGANVGGSGVYAPGDMPSSSAAPPLGTTAPSAAGAHASKVDGRPAAAGLDGSNGADIDLEVESNLLLMIKLAVLQQDAEDIVKLSRMAVVDQNLEREVHVLLTTEAVYILHPGHQGSGGQYHQTAAIAYSTIAAVNVAAGGQSLLITAKVEAGGGGGQSKQWRLVTGDGGVTKGFVAALVKAAEAAGHSPPRVRERDSHMTDSIAQLLQEQGDENSTVGTKTSIGLFRFVSFCFV
jgi:hypothetical protein